MTKIFRTERQKKWLTFWYFRKYRYGLNYEIIQIRNSSFIPFTEPIKTNEADEKDQV